MSGSLSQKKPIGALQDPAFGGSLSQAMPDAQFYKDVGGRLYDLVVGGVQDVFATPARWSDPNWSLRGMEAQAWKNNPAGEMNRVMAGPLGLAPLGATVYHGSPHKFDAFDASKIGTGEGAQAYGHGLYVAESPEVAKQYAGQLTSTAIRPKSGNPIMADSRSVGVDAEGTAARYAAIAHKNGAFGPNNQAGGWDSAIESAKQWKAGDDVISKLEQWKKEGATLTTESNLYKADLPDEMIPKMLDWDKPLSQQPEAIRKVIKDRHFRPYNHQGEGVWSAGGKYIVFDKPTGKYIGTGLGGKILDRFDSLEAALEKYGHDSGSSIYATLAAELGGDAKASEFLRKAGITGARYLDGGSRTSGKGTYNYVVFPGEEKQLKILSRE